MATNTYYAWKAPNGQVCMALTDTAPAATNTSVNGWELLYAVLAATWEEAMAVQHLRQGWGPYRPLGEPAECPTCRAIYYPQGSGVCWRGHVNGMP
jgi:hypothetical protein